MSFRARLTLVAAAAVALAIVLASAVVYVVVRGQLRAPIDDALRERAALISRIPLGEIRSRSGEAFLALPRAGFGEANVYVQVVKSDGTTVRELYDEVRLRPDERTLGVARGAADSFFADADVAGTHLRVLTLSYSPGVALQVARSLDEVDAALDRITLFLILIAGGGIGVAAALGLAVSRAALAPVRRLTETTERVTETRDLSERIDTGGRDELSRLAASFNTMLGALEESTRAQRQLVADASHELRTPLTSVRTNIEVLMSERELPPDERRKLLADVVEQLGELTTLIAELIELARSEQPPAEPEDVRLDLLAGEALERVRRNRPGIAFTADLDESLVFGDPVSIERAIGNLLDNAAKWSSAGAEVHLEVRDGRVTVRDHGPGIDEEDLPYVFDRFYRARTARRLPGSGLGLAIVRQVAEVHAGEVVAERAEGGGTRVTLRLNGRRPVDASGERAS